MPKLTVTQSKQLLKRANTRNEDAIHRDLEDFIGFMEKRIKITSKMEKYFQSEVLVEIPPRYLDVIDFILPE